MSAPKKEKRSLETLAVTVFLLFTFAATAEEPIPVELTGGTPAPDIEAPPVDYEAIAVNSLEVGPLQEGLNTDGIAFDANNYKNGRSFKYRAAAQTAEEGKGGAIATAAVFMVKGIPRTASLVAPVRQAGFSLIGRAALEFAQAAADEAAAKQNYEREAFSRQDNSTGVQMSGGLYAPLAAGPSLPVAPLPPGTPPGSSSYGGGAADPLDGPYSGVDLRGPKPLATGGPSGGSGWVTREEKPPAALKEFPTDKTWKGSDLRAGTPFDSDGLDRVARVSAVGDVAGAGNLSGAGSLAGAGGLGAAAGSGRGAGAGDARFSDGAAASGDAGTPGTNSADSRAVGRGPDGASAGGSVAENGGRGSAPGGRPRFEARPGYGLSLPGDKPRGLPGEARRGLSRALAETVRSIAKLTREQLEELGVLEGKAGDHIFHVARRYYRGFGKWRDPRRVAANG